MMDRELSSVPDFFYLSIIMTKNDILSPKNISKPETSNSETFNDYNNYALVTILG